MLTKLITLIKRCRISKPGNDSGEYPISQVSYYGKTGNSEEIYPYGMGGVAPSDSLGVLFSVGAEDSNRAHIATAPSLRPKNLKPGESYFGNLLSKSIIQPDATVVKFFAYDEYSTSVPIDYLFDNNIIMAYKTNNVTLPPERGFPFQLVAESKLGYKWIKWITKIEVSDDTNHLGYWERRGYPNEADWESQE